MLLAAFLIASAPALPAPVTYDELVIGQKQWLRVVARASEFPTGDKSEASLTVGTGGRVGVAWQSRRQLGGLSGTYLREFTSTGLSVSGEQRAGTESRFHEAKPSLVYAAQLLPFYESAWRDDSGVGVFAGAHTVPESLKGDQTDVVATRLDNGRVLAVWSTQIARNERRIFGRILNSLGKPIGKQFRISNSPGSSDVLPSIAVDGDSVAVAWQAIGDNGSPGGIWAARLDSGVPVGARLVAPKGVEPSLSATGNGFVLGWNEAKADGYRVRARLLDSALSATHELAVPQQGGHQNAVAVAAQDNGTVAVAWNRSATDEDREIWLRLYSSSGRPLADAEKLHAGALAEATGRQRMAWAGGTLCLAWSGDAGLGDSKAAHVTFLSPKTSVRRSDLTALANAAVVPTPVVPNALSGGGIQFVAQAGPHEPPTYNPKNRLDPWGARPPQMDGSGFTAVVSTGWTPPDPHMAVGPLHIGVMTNGQIAFFTKDGTNVFRDEIEDNFGFWGALGATNFVFDPEIIYDESVDRWMAMACERGSNGRSYFLLAVSDDDNPLGTWFKYRLDVTTQGGGGDIDSPNLSTDDECVYLSADFFTGGQKYLVFILRKSDLLTGNPTPLTRSHLITGQQSHGLPMTHDAGAPQYLIEHFEATSNTTVRLHSINDPLGAPTRTTFNLTVPQYGRPENPPQAGTTVRPTSFDSRFWSCVYRNGSLWATHHINSSRVLARWYEIRMNNWPSGGNPELVQSGDIDVGGTVRTFFSSIAVDQQGNAAVLCARSSPSEFISMFRALRKSTDPLGTMSDRAIIKESDGPYFTSRWGDYSAVVVDPMESGTFWGHHEYSVAGTWHTWVESFRPTITVIERPVEQIIPILAGPINGGLPEIATADGVLLSIDSVANPPTRTFSSTVDYIATAGAQPMSQLSVRTVAKSGAGIGFARISLLNRQTGVYDVLGTQLLGMGSLTTFTLPGQGDVNRYADPSTREMRMRMEFNLGPQPTTFRPPLLIDEIKFVTGT